MRSAVPLACGLAVLGVVLVERLTRPAVAPPDPAFDPGLAEDREVAALDAIWELSGRIPPHEATAP